MPKKKPLSREQEKEIGDLYLAGWSTVQLSKKYKMAAATVVRILRDVGVKCRSVSESSAMRANRDASTGPIGNQYLFHSEKNEKWIPAASSYEYIRLWQLERNGDVISFDRCSDRIPYFMDGKNRHYTPDFIVLYKDGRTQVEEIKPVPLLYKFGNFEKFISAINYYRGKNISFVIVTERTIGCSAIATFEWSGIAKLSKDEREKIIKDRTRERATLWARNKRAKTTMTKEEKKKHAERSMDYYKRWKASASEDQLAERRERARIYAISVRKRKKDARINAH